MSNGKKTPGCLGYVRDIRVFLQFTNLKILMNRPVQRKVGGFFVVQVVLPCF